MAGRTKKGKFPEIKKANEGKFTSWAKKNGFKTAMIAGQDRQLLESDINNIVLDCKYFHTVEVLSLILFYDLIHACGAECPSIKAEVIRKGTAMPLSRNPLK